MTTHARHDRESQRDSATKPRVASNELPWEKRALIRANPERVVPLPLASQVRTRPATTLSGLRPRRDWTQGSSFLGTLGWRAQSLRDWPLLLLEDDQAGGEGRRSSRTQVRQRGGHTLIELMAVVVILVVLAAAITPVVIRRMDRAAWTKEVIDMGAISNALALQILRNYKIPSETNWAPFTATFVSRPVSQILTNNRGYARLFLYESSGWMTNTAYIQTSTGTWINSNAPPNVRLAMVSTIAKALPYVNGAITTSNFNTIWNAAQFVKPSFFSAWAGKAEDLIIQRVTLDPLFHRLILINRDASTNALFSINTNSTVAVPATGSGSSAYYVDSTSVGLWSNTVPTHRFLLNCDISFTFENGLWQAQLTGGGKDNGPVAQTFTVTTQEFLNARLNPNVVGSNKGGTQGGVLMAMYSFMFGYNYWANEPVPFDFHGDTVSQLPEYQLLDVMGSPNPTGGQAKNGFLDYFSNNLIQ